MSTTTFNPAGPPKHVYLWVWLPEATEPIVAARLDNRGAVVNFTYARSYLERTAAVALYLPELPLRHGEFAPLSGEIAGCVADAAPDAWGRRVIQRRRGTLSADLPILTYLLESGSDRIGAFDFQTSATHYQARSGDTASLSELAQASDRVERGEPLTPALNHALLQGTSIGGARPKAMINDREGAMIAKFSSSTDPYPVVKAEYIAMELARRADIDVAPVRLEKVFGKDVLMVKRFDRTDTGARRMMVSALTILARHDAYGIAGRYATYIDLAHQIRARFTNPNATLRELFSRIVFNILVSNTDDHARNHSAFWNGTNLTLTPAYDICPQLRAGGETAQAMAFGPNGDRLSQISRCVTHASHYHLTHQQAKEIAEQQIATIHTHWNEVCDLAETSSIDKEQLWGRQFLNPYALEEH